MDGVLSRWRSAFWFKAALAAALVALADTLFYRQQLGGGLGLFALAALLAAAMAHPALQQDRRALVAVGVAGGFALLLADRPGVIAWGMFWTALGVAVLSPRGPRRWDVAAWAQGLAFAALAAIPAPARDALRANRLGAGPIRLKAVVSTLLLPLAGGALFLAMFAAANPIIDQGLQGLSLPRLNVGRALFWLLCAVVAWGVMRPRFLRRPITIRPGRGAVAPASSVVVSLVLFNALFALQNALDIGFLWSGAPLPEGVSFADYAHRGAYMLIATALLAGAFVLVFLQPGSESASRPAVRGLVVAWTAQNLLLVASSGLRTLDYVDAYGLTQLRIAALVWMALVAAGLALICMRLVQRRGASWLINANAVALGVALTAVSVADLGAIAAYWNVRHAREVDGSGAALDLCYLNGLNGAALLPLIELEHRDLPPDLRDRVTQVRRWSLTEVAARQRDWRAWTLRDQRRLDAAHARLAALPVREIAPGARDCSGALNPPPPSAPLTPPPGAGT